MGRRDLSTKKRNQYVQFILQCCINRKPRRGKHLEAQLKFRVSRPTVTQLWRAAKKQQENGEVIHLMSDNTVIMSKWPEEASKGINIQQDNAKPHIVDSDPEFRAAASQSGFNIKLTQQPQNSPYCNVNDLRWFRAIQSLQVETACNTFDELLMAVVDSFRKLSPHTLNNVFLSLQGCMIEIMKFKCQNCYKIPHMTKGALRRSDQLPVNLEMPMKLIQQCINYLSEMGNNEGMTELVQQLGLDMIEGY